MKDKEYLTEEEKQEMLKEIEFRKEELLKEGGPDEFTGKNKFFKILTYFCLALSLVLMICYSVQTIINSSGFLTQITNIIGTVILSIFTIFFMFTSLFADHKKGRVFIIIASLLLSIYSGFNLLVGADIIKVNKNVVIDFYNKEITEVIDWAEKHDIFIKQVYKNDEKIEKYRVMKQDVEPGTSLKKVQKITVTVSDGPNPEKETLIPNMIGWNIDQALKYIEENHLTNTSIEFDFNEKVKRDIIYSQNIESTIKRSEPLELKVSLGKKGDFQYVTMIDLVGKNEFQATIWLKRNYIDYEIQYGYSDSYEEGIVIEQGDKKGKVFDITRNPKTTITLARNHEISVPNLMEMDATKINSWAAKNKIKIIMKEEYDEKVSKGKVIESSRLKGDTVEVGDTINIRISKGQLHMIQFTNVQDFITWANQEEISYSIDYQFSTEKKAGELISSSHKEDQLVKNTDTISLVISQGGTANVPDFQGMNKSQIEDSCKRANLICEYKYEENQSVEKNQFIKQSMKAGSEVPAKTTITITLSSGN